MRKRMRCFGNDLPSMRREHIEQHRPRDAGGAGRSWGGKCAKSSERSSSTKNTRKNKLGEYKREKEPPSKSNARHAA